MDLESLDRLPEQLLTLLTEPTANPTASMVLFGIIGLVLLILLLAVVMFIMATPEDDEVVVTGGSRADDGPSAAEAPSAAPVAPREPRTPQQMLATMLVGAAVFSAVWVTAGYTTSTGPVCESCHLETPHMAAEDREDPHAGQTCASCHEPGSVISRYTINLVPRVSHFAEGLMSSSLQDGYGKVTRSACSSCHSSEITGTTVNEDRGLRMSHSEPLEASASCLDCHAMQSGVVSNHNVGMNPCLRCHDSETASAECSTCHDRQAASAARASSTEFADVQVAEVRCGSCHNEERDCDSCHGTRLPHTREFMAYAHARAGAVDFWYNDGKMCAQCHTPERRPCQRCHTSMLGKGHGPAMRSHAGSSEQGCNTCHTRWAYSPQRDFCTDVCHSPAAIEGSKR